MRFLCHIALLSTFATCSVYAEPDELSKLRASYHAKVEEVAGVGRKALVERLAATEKELAEASKLEEALIVREERIRLSLGKDITSLVREGSGSQALEDIAAIYNKSLSTKLIPIDKTYIGALQTLEKRFSSAGRLDDAIAAHAEREKVAAKYAEPAPEPVRPTEPPEDQAGRQLYLTNSIWQLATDKAFTGAARYFALQDDGKAYFWGFSGSWSISAGGEKLVLDSPHWGKRVELSLDDDLANAKGIYLKDRSDRFARRVMLRTE